MKALTMQTKHYWGTAVFLVSLLIIALLAGRLRLNAAPTNSATLAAAQDSYTDRNLPTANFDSGLLIAANSSGGPQNPDLPTKYIYLGFDLSGVSFAINSASLKLSTFTCGGLIMSDDVNVAVYGVDNSALWTANGLTWDTQPTPSTGILTTLDAGAITANSAQTYAWTDYNRGALSTWLETQRTANNGRATLALAVENSNNPGLSDVFFEDSEGSGAAYGCADAGILPALDVSVDVTHFVYLPAVQRQ